jgi:hypothetical protein
VVVAGGEFYWSGNREVRPLDNGAWVYKPGYYVHGVEGARSGPLWVLSDGAGGALDRVDPETGERVWRFRPGRRGAGNYQRLGADGPLAVCVLRTRSESSGGVLLVGMRSHASAWLSAPASPAHRGGCGRFFWVVDRDALRLGRLDTDEFAWTEPTGV